MPAALTIPVDYIHMKFQFQQITTAANVLYEYYTAPQPHHERVRQSHKSTFLVYVDSLCSNTNTLSRKPTTGGRGSFQGWRAVTCCDML